MLRSTDGLVDSPLDWYSGAVGSVVGSVTDFLCDLGQAILRAMSKGIDGAFLSLKITGN